MTTSIEEILQTPEGRRGQAVQDYANEIGSSFMHLMMRDGIEFSFDEETAIQSVTEKIRSDLHNIANDIAMGERRRFDWT